jgi:Ulp1 family protease
MLLLVVPPKGSIWLFDSLATDRPARLQGVRELIKDAIKVVGHDNIKLSLKQAEIAHQTNGNDCGAHVVVNAIALSQDDQPAREIESLDIPRDRLSMGQMIARGYWEQRLAAKLAETETTKQ